MIGVRAAILLLALALSAGAARAVTFEPRQFATPTLEVRYKHLIDELRCLVCQNQNIADSDAPLAQDLRREVYRMLHEGRTDGEITAYMTARYGDFVLYRPPVNAVTALLWAGPALLVLAGLAVLARALTRRGGRAPAGALSEEERSRLDALLARDQRD